MNSKIIVVPKMSKYERDLAHYGISHMSLMEKYASEGVDAERIVESHYRQKDAAKGIARLAGEKCFVEREKLTKDLAKDSIVVALGGDDHFKYVSHFIEDSFIIGVNSDPIRSIGALAGISVQDFGKMLGAIRNGHYFVEEWTRLEMNLNGNGAGRAVSECYLGAADSEDMSHYVIELNGENEEQRSSGLIITTGAGSTGWYRSAGRYLFGDGDIFPRTEKSARFLMREPYGDYKLYRLAYGAIREGEELAVTSLHNSDGRVSLDSTDRREFNRGARAVFTVSDKPLKVVKLGGC